MKRVFNFSLLLVAVLVIGFASCKNNKSEPPKPNPDTTKEENVKYEFLYAGFLEYLNMVNKCQCTKFLLWKRVY